MITQDNIANQPGDVLIVTASAVRGLIAVSGYNDGITGENAERFFFKEFRYSRDGVLYHPWAALTTADLQGIDLDGRILYFQFRYTRQGLDNEGPLIWNNTWIEGSYILSERDLPVRRQTVFRRYPSDDLGVEAICVNLTRKLYELGIVPRYVLRKEGTDEQNLTNDRDYVDFWRGLSAFFALLIAYQYRLERIRLERELLVPYLQQRGIFVAGTESLSELQTLADNYLLELFNRGTSKALETTGEIGRLVGREQGRELLTAFLPGFSRSWMPRMNSPLFRYLGVHGTAVSKIRSIWPEEQAPESFQAPFSLTNSAAIHIDMLEGFRVVAVEHTTFGLAAIEVRGLTFDPSLAYEIRFRLRSSAQQPGSGVTVQAIPRYGVPSQVINLERIDTLVATTDFFSVPYLPPVSNTWYEVRCLILPQGTSQRTTGQSRLNVGYGRALRFPTTAEKFQEMSVRLIFSWTGGQPGSLMYMDGMRINPVDDVPILVNGGDSLLVIRKVNNQSLSENQVDQAIENFIAPYGVQSNIVRL